MDNIEEVFENYIPPVFEAIPLQDEVEYYYDSFVFVRGKKPRKVGITIERRMKKRYYPTNLYEQISEESVFARATNSKIAVAIENMMKKILINAGDSANPHDTTPGTTTEDTSYIIYLVERKDEDSKCNICTNVYIEDEMERKAHFEKVHWKEIVLYNRALEQLKSKGIKNGELVERIETILKWSKYNNDKKVEDSQPSSSSKVTPPVKKFKKN
ncbi:hypothetical protein PVAND_010910 [Polypedilum vanderplanki]|uniref:Uncharacterized protein n=1 Tax=Polypedilum vanderplanki TaxID=319348 RepID=A0A9J6CIT1_POLVA|nr:hypothetical protein PVAND_010910 [Polypedilum vanderplanki]